MWFLGWGIGREYEVWVCGVAGREEEKEGEENELELTFFSFLSFLSIFPFFPSLQLRALQHHRSKGRRSSHRPRSQEDLGRRRRRRRQVDGGGLPRVEGHHVPRARHRSRTRGRRSRRVARLRRHRNHHLPIGEGLQRRTLVSSSSWNEGNSRREEPFPFPRPRYQGTLLVRREELRSSRVRHHRIGNLVPAWRSRRSLAQQLGRRSRTNPFGSRTR